MGAIEGVIVLSATNELILNSHFTHPLSNYPVLHVDRFLTKLDEANGKASLAPILFNDTIPNHLDIQDEEEEEAEGEAEEADDRILMPRKRGTALVHLEQNRLRFLAIFSDQLDPLVPLTFLRKLVAVMELYFGPPVTEEAIRDNLDVVYQLLEEMLDESGEPLNTEYNTLRELVREPSWLDSVISKVGAMSGISTNSALGNALSQPHISSIPWRRPLAAAQGRQTRNEIYIDASETLSAIYSRGVHARPIGPIALTYSLSGNSKLGGTPDVLLQLSNTGRITDASLHACVRLKSWQKDRGLSFIPPDGQFDLASFRLESVKALEKHVPLLVRASRSVTEGDQGTSMTEVHVIVSCSAPVEDLELRFGISDTNCSMESSLSGGARPGIASEDLSALKGTFHFDARTGLARWAIGSLTVDQRPLELRATIKSESFNAALSNCVTSTFTAAEQKSLSGIRVSSLEIVNDVGYKPYKGVRSAVRGSLDWRW